MQRRFFVAVAICLPAWAAAEPPSAARVLTKAREIAAEITPPDKPPARVVFEGSVAYQDPQRSIILADETGVTFVLGGLNRLVQPGDLVRVTGSAHQGLIIGGIKSAEIEVIGRGDPPAATPVAPSDLATGRYHYHRIAIEGVIRKVVPADDAALTLMLHAAGEPVRVEVEASAAEAPSAAKRLIDAQVRVTGLVVGNINDRRQVVEPFIRVKRLDDVEVLEPPPKDAFGIPATPFDALVSRALGDHRVHVRGIAVAGPLGGAIYLRNGDRSLRVVTADGQDGVCAGDLVEAAGFPQMGKFSVELADAVLCVTGTGPTPAPRPALDKPRSAFDRPDADLVAIEGTVIDVGNEPRVVVRHGAIDYTIEPPAGSQIAADAGSLVRATGVCRVTAVESNSYYAYPRAYTLLLETPTAFRIVRSPPWWTPHRLMIAVATGIGASAVVAGLAATWIVMLKRQVHRQLAVIEGNIQAEAVAEERRRIAREFHDSVNQGLAAASLRLDAAAYRVIDVRSKTVLDRQRQLLVKLQSEAREFIWDLRDPIHADAPLAAAIEAQLDFIAAPSGTTVAFEPPAGPDPAAGLSAETRHQIVRIVREAVANAVRYAEASRIAVRLSGYESGGLTIDIADDGTGFDVAARVAADGHFGICGMQERARRIGGRLTIHSSPGSGTRVTLAMGNGSSPLEATLTPGTTG
jgi:signal transduction histidine kinase